MESLVDGNSLSSLMKYCTAGFIHSGKEKLTTQEYIREFGIKTASAEEPVSSLSGGNQQKVAIAKCLDNSPEIFIFDGATRKSAAPRLEAAPLSLFDICDYPIILCEMGKAVVFRCVRNRC